eukprot:CAMPEP_0198129440 /NCGR_PEP_ID=MMETSP1442-20131203/51737_1 /TAXON_ID= /ORGANISM="Craspedostauros australis, Strain CCMP3328" /LENGTH=344 /DNA_ID=CAMNT_0043789831 /DNA_START=231 /DNA_END=1265 /DNA_ORIENTATION=+
MSASNTDSDARNDDQRIVVVGSTNQDLISNTNILPTLGETVMGDTFTTACGGKGANQAVAAASLGLVPVSMLCRVGDDIFGRNLLDNFRRVNVEFDEATTVLADTPSGVASITVDSKSGDNMIIVSPGANYAMTKDDVRKSLLEAKPAVVVVQLEIKPEVALEALKVGKEIGAITILNTAPAPEGWTLEDPGQEFYPHVDILIPNETELQKICQGMGSDTMTEEEMAKALLAKGVQSVLVTLGARGAMIVTNDGDSAETAVTLVDAPEDLPARNEPVQDTIGAGDAFCGALAAYLSMGVSLQQSAIFACGVASMSVRKVGAQTSYPTKADLPPCLQLESIQKAA